MYDPLTAAVLVSATVGGITAMESAREQKKALRQQRELADEQFQLQKDAAEKEETRLAKQESDLAAAGERAKKAAQAEKKEAALRRGRGSTIIAGQTTDLQNLAKLGQVRKRKLGAGTAA
jgi:hypothetical protein